MSSLKFVHTNSVGYKSRSRKRIQACENCRRQKRRCVHTISSTVGPARQGSAAPQTAAGFPRAAEEPSIQVVSALPSEQPRQTGRDSTAYQSEPTPRVTSASRHPTNVSSSPGNLRFIGDLNPEVVLLSGTRAESGLSPNAVGVWQPEPLALVSRQESDCATSSPASIFHYMPRLIRGLLLPLIREQCLEVLPPPTDLAALEVFYFNNIHGLLPSIDEQTFTSSLSHAPSRVLQYQTICLLASTEPSLAHHLRLPTREGQLTSAEFGQELLSAMRLNVDMAMVHDKMILIRALTTMSLFGFGRQSIEASSQYFVRAVQISWNIGLHLQRGRDGAQSSQSSLFCYLWAIDKFLAAVHGRPTMMHERDLELSPLRCLDGQPPGFKVLVHIAHVLQDVISLYRPNATVTQIPREAIPSYETILERTDALELPAHHLATLELFYHGVVILSCRQKAEADGPSTLPHPRQHDAASQISSIMMEADLSKLPLLPFVPYCISLSLSIFYRRLRCCKLSKHQREARKAMWQSFEILSRLGHFFWSAAFMAELAQGILVQTSTSTEDLTAAPFLQSNQSMLRPLHGSLSSAPGMSARPGTETSMTDSTVGSFEALPTSQSVLEDFHPSSDLSAVLGSEWDLDRVDCFIADSLDPSVPASYLEIESPHQAREDQELLEISNIAPDASSRTETKRQVVPHHPFLLLLIFRDPTLRDETIGLFECLFILQHAVSRHRNGHAPVYPYASHHSSAIGYHSREAKG
ncbi:hypothetical protein N8I77_001330 [Diaporthe amygdali]|uniref:Xylanolytic transcriptional activator regulatory domain-containing protein n=1 Tax=Phomopsis amygdali TaxID=1214568 RepID=A0AAD9SRF6_PHOAM|nr:hypothetical protein N8I77_001330 [Diaporthe amygdali]